MPNWVYNCINGYTPEMYEKYKGEGTDFDFNKLIPMPEELDKLPAGSFADEAKDIYEWNEYKKKYPLDELEQIAYRTELSHRLDLKMQKIYCNAGEVALAFPDKSMNQILTEFSAPFNAESTTSNKEKYLDNGRKFFVKDIENLREITGRDDCRRTGSFYAINGNSFGLYKNKDEDKEVYASKVDMINRYADKIEERYTEYRENNKLDPDNEKKYRDRTVDYFENLSDMGKAIVDAEEKYGFANWYDWSCANWGTKWNACDPSYDEEDCSLRFDTAWSVPEPVLAKLQDENKNAILDVYSEEETGWWNRYHTKGDGHLHCIEQGQYEYKEDENGNFEQISDGKVEVDRSLEYEKVKEEAIAETNYINDMKKSWSIA